MYHPSLTALPDTTPRYSNTAPTFDERLTADEAEVDVHQLDRLSRHAHRHVMLERAMHANDGFVAPSGVRPSSAPRRHSAEPVPHQVAVESPRNSAGQLEFSWTKKRAGAAPAPTAAAPAVTASALAASSPTWSWAWTSAGARFAHVCLPRSECFPRCATREVRASADATLRLSGGAARTRSHQARGGLRRVDSRPARGAPAPGHSWRVGESAVVRHERGSVAPGHHLAVQAGLSRTRRVQPRDGPMCLPQRLFGRRVRGARAVPLQHATGQCHHQSLRGVVRRRCVLPLLSLSRTR